MCAPILAAAPLLAQVGTVVGAVATVAQGVSANRAAQSNAQMLRERATTEAQLATTQDQRERLTFMRQIRSQAAELIGRGVQLNSPTAVMLGEEAGRELSFHSQAIRSGAQATSRELDWSARQAEAEGRSALLKGTLSAAAGLLTAAPDVWPSLMSGGAA